MTKFLKLPNGELAKLADLQRQEELKRNSQTRPPRCLQGFASWFFASANRTDRRKYARSLRNSPSANSSAWSLRSSWTWSRALPKKNWKVKTGSVWWPDSATEATRNAGRHSRVPGHEYLRR